MHSAVNSHNNPFPSPTIPVLPSLPPPRPWYPPSFLILCTHPDNTAFTNPNCGCLSSFTPPPPPPPLSRVSPFLFSFFLFKMPLSPSSPPSHHPRRVFGKRFLCLCAVCVPVCTSIRVPVTPCQLSKHCSVCWKLMGQQFVSILLPPPPPPPFPLLHLQHPSTSPLLHCFQPATSNCWFVR